MTGTITLDGEPTPGLAVLFSQSGFRSSSGITNEAGEYELSYIKDTKGAVVGEHRVRIEFVQREGAGRRVQLPERYNRSTELTATVKSGRNKIDFDLVSE